MLNTFFSSSFMIALSNGAISHMRVIAPFLTFIFFTSFAASIFMAVENKYRKPTSNFEMVNVSFEMGELGDCEKPLTFLMALHFVATLETTIGYGDVWPCSVWGQLITIVICLFGVPIFFFCLSHLGVIFEIILNYAWRKGRRIYRMIRPRVSPISDNSRRKPKTGTEVVIPISFGLAVTILWILLCSVYFYFSLNSAYQDTGMDPEWNFFAALYFTIISLQTIGYGDISPVNYEFVLINFGFLFVGLTLVTMCISIIRRKVDSLFDETVQLINEQYNEAIKNGSSGGNRGALSVPINEKGNRKFNVVNQNPNSGWLSNFMSDHDQQLLNDLLEEKSQLTNREVQTDDSDKHVAVQATVSMIDGEMITDLKTREASIQCRAVKMKDSETQTHKIHEASSLPKPPVHEEEQTKTDRGARWMWLFNQ